MKTIEKRWNDLFDNQSSTKQDLLVLCNDAIKELAEARGKLEIALGALEDIGYAKTWLINRPLDMVKVALEALKKIYTQGYGE